MLSRMISVCSCCCLLTTVASQNASAVSGPPAWKPRRSVGTSSYANQPGDRFLAYDHHGVPSIAYTTEQGNAVFSRQVAGIGWRTNTLNSGDARGASITFDRYELPAVSYGASDGLHFTRYVPSTGFVDELLDDTSVSGRSWTTGTSVAFDLLGSPAVAAGDTGDLYPKVYYFSDSDGDGTLTSADALTFAGTYETRPTLTFDPLNRPVIGAAYLNASNGDADVLIRDPFIEYFRTEFLSNADPGATDERNVSVAIDPDDGMPAVAWTHPQDRQLWYAKWNELTNLWDQTLVDTAPVGTELGNESLAFDPGDGQPAISYSDNQGNVHFAWENGGIWNTQVVDSNSGVTFSRTSLAFNEFGHGFPAIAYIIDAPDPAQDFLYFTVDPPTVVPEPGGQVVLLVSLLVWILRSRRIA